MTRKSPTITSKALQTLLTRIGSASSGTKATLRERLLRDLEQSRLHNCHATWNAQGVSEWGRKLRLVSIDMGIKNLAFCDTEISYPTGSKLHPTMEVLRWEKLDLVQRTRELRTCLPSPRPMKKGSASEDENVDPYSLSVLSETAYRLIKQTILSSSPDIVLIEKQRWRSGGGSAVQQWTVRVNTLEGMLWAVLATLRAERVHMTPKQKETQPYASKDFNVYAVDPKRVGTYWLQHDSHTDTSASNHTLARKSEARLKGAPEQCLKEEENEDDENGEAEVERRETEKKIPRTKAEKKAKIGLLRSWLNATPHSTTGASLRTHPITKKTESSPPPPPSPISNPETPTLSFILHPSTNPVHHALCAPSKSKSKSKFKSRSIGDTDDIDVDDAEVDKAPKKMSVDEARFKKLDDVTDCFLQAAAWVSWEANRMQLIDVKSRRRNGNEAVGEREEEVLLDMIKEVGGA